MVSLSRHLNSFGSGAVFFDAGINMDDEAHLQPVLASHELEIFDKIETIRYVSVPLVFAIALEVTGIIFISVWPEQQKKCDTYFIMLYLHCAFWLIIIVIQDLLSQVHETQKLRGYLDFYKSTYMLVRAPFYVSSLWNTFFLLLSVILHHTHQNNYEEYCRASEWFTPLNYIVLLTTFELAIIIPIYANYIKRILRFNRSKPLPDVLREEWLSLFTQDSYAGEVGYHQGRLNLLSLLEKQADFIEYLRDRNIWLSHRMLLLASQPYQAETS